jgi:hypothetical protein
MQEKVERNEANHAMALRRFGEFRVGDIVTFGLRVFVTPRFPGRAFEMDIDVGARLVRAPLPMGVRPRVEIGDDIEHKDGRASGAWEMPYDVSLGGPSTMDSSVNALVDVITLRNEIPEHMWSPPISEWGAVPQVMVPGIVADGIEAHREVMRGTSGLRMRENVVPDIRVPYIYMTFMRAPTLDSTRHSVTVTNAISSYWSDDQGAGPLRAISGFAFGHWWVDTVQMSEGKIVRVGQCCIRPPKARIELGATQTGVQCGNRHAFAYHPPHAYAVAKFLPDILAPPPSTDRTTDHIVVVNLVCEYLLGAYIHPPRVSQNHFYFLS